MSDSPAPSVDARLRRQLAFALEVDRLKLVDRMISTIGGRRRENSAEHSWHLAILAPILAEYAPEGTDLARAQRMVLVHDVVEIDAGDAFAFDPEAQAGQEARERAAAERIFGLLPSDQAKELRAVWEEFEARETPTARFAHALDRFQGMLMNRGNDGGTWIEHDVSREAILRRMEPIRRWTPGLWPLVLETLEQVGRGA